MAFIQHRTVRFDDVDFAQVVFFPNFFLFCHNAFEDFFGQEAGIPYAQLVRERNVGFPTVSTRADFRAPLRFGDRFRVVMEVLRVGQRSVTSRYRINRDAERCAELEVVTACIETRAFKAQDIPGEIREALLRHLVTEDATAR